MGLHRALLWAMVIVGLVVAVTGEKAGYVAVGSPFDNPLTDVELTPSIPNSPDCTIRPQTVLEIQRMREAANRIAKSIEIEVGIMSKRKAYVEQMTTYLNDRIRELNKVKSELATEARWIEVSNGRISELSQREKLIKYQDILSCLNSDKLRLNGETATKQNAMTNIQSKTTKLKAAILDINTQIENIRANKKFGPDGAEIVPEA